jgi:hypothetical protein
MSKKLRRVLGVGKEKTIATAPLSAVPAAEARPGAWKTMLLPAPDEETVNKHRHVPVAIDEQIVKDVADGGQPSEIEDAYSVRRGYVRTVLIRRFGSIEAMKRALQGQCLENALALNEHAMKGIATIAPERALVGAKVMIDGALSLEKSMVDKPLIIDFAALALLGQVLAKIEKKVEGKVIDV